MLIMPVTAMVRRMVLVLSWVATGRIAGLWGWRCSDAGCRALYQLVEFAPIKPNASALWAVVNFDALAFGHQQAGFRADGAFHGFLFASVCAINTALVPLHVWSPEILRSLP